MGKILFTGISELVTNAGVAKKGGVGVTEEDLGIIENGALLWDTSKGIVWLGSKKEIPSAAKQARKKNLEGRTLTPALADCHTHMVHAGSRHNEFSLRLKGATYQEIAAAGGGIASSVRATRAATEIDLFKTACERLETSQKLGVGLLEVKTGYGLNWESERKQLKVIQRLKRKYKGSMHLQSTFLGAHAFPPEATTSQARRDYVDKALDKMLSQIAREKLADACDVFFDEGYFDRDQTKRILSKAAFMGLEIKLHADELADVGGAKLAAELGALSADHLLKANDEGLQLMGKRGVVAVLLPTTAFYLGLPYASVEKMRRAHLCMALATDFNPGSSPTLHLPFVASLAVLATPMTLPEAFVGITYAGARAMGMQNQNGFLRAGSKPKMAIFNCPSYKSLIQQVAHPGLCEQVF